MVSVRSLLDTLESSPPDFFCWCSITVDVDADAAGDDLVKEAALLIRFVDAPPARVTTTTTTAGGANP